MVMCIILWVVCTIRRLYALCADGICLWATLSLGGGVAVFGWADCCSWGGHVWLPCCQWKHGSCSWYAMVPLYMYLHPLVSPSIFQIFLPFTLQRNVLSIVLTTILYITHIYLNLLCLTLFYAMQLLNLVWLNTAQPNSDRSKYLQHLIKHGSTKQEESKHSIQKHL